eukprot:Ihof_evm1s973 gene=Ihof_evmTU1s973
MSLLEQLKKVLGTDDLYKVLGLTDRKVTPGNIKSAYYKASLKWHPDRVKEEEKANASLTKHVIGCATLKFQLLGKAYAVLSDEESRKIYDETGDVGEDGFTPDDLKDKDWAAYWRVLFKNVTVDDINKFKQSYQGSPSEKEDLMQAYNDHKGNMTQILEHVMCAEVEDEPRLKAILRECISEKLIKPYDAFTKEKATAPRKRREKAQKEEKEAKKLAKDLGINVEGGANEE